MDPHRHLYKDYLLSCAPLLLDDGLYQARVAITYLGGQRTRSQRFLDLDTFATECEAVAAAHAAGIEWVDREVA
jgi:hypothetical protein